MSVSPREGPRISVSPVAVSPVAVSLGGVVGETCEQQDLLGSLEELQGLLE